MTWGRNEVGGLLMVGASIISALETAIFSKWVDAQIAGNANLSSLIAWIGFISITLTSVAWLASRVVMNQALPEGNKLKWKISILIILIYLLMAGGWLYAATKVDIVSVNSILQPKSAQTHRRG